MPFQVANLGGFQLQLGHYGEALALLDEAIAASSNTPHLARRLAQRGTALAGLGRTVEAAASFDRAVDLAAARDSEESIAVRRSRARFLTLAGRFDEAMRDLRFLTDAIDEGRAHTVPSDLMRRGFTEAQQDVFGAYIDLLGRQGKASDALNVAERARARAFLDLRAERVGDARLATPASVADAQRAAARHHSTILAYWVGPAAVSIWVVRPDRAPALVRVPVLPSHLTSLIRATSGLGSGAARRAVADDRSRSTGPVARLERLLSPRWSLAAAPAWRRLTIVPHGPLFALSSPLRGADGRALLEAHDLHTCGDRALVEPQADGRPPESSAVMGRSSSAIGPLQTEPAWSRCRRCRGRRREVAAIGPPRRRHDRADRSRRDESAVRAALTGRRVLHFATPASSATRPPARRSSPFIRRRRRRRLLADEIYDLRPRRPGRPQRLPAALGPSRRTASSLRARLPRRGARSVVATQWDVSDR